MSLAQFLMVVALAVIAAGAIISLILVLRYKHHCRHQGAPIITVATPHGLVQRPAKPGDVWVQSMEDGEVIVRNWDGKQWREADIAGAVGELERTVRPPRRIGGSR